MQVWEREEVQEVLWRREVKGQSGELSVPRRIPWLTTALALACAGVIVALALMMRARSRDARVAAKTKHAAEMVLLGNYGRAITDYDEALADRPGNVALLEVRATLKYAAGDLAGAQADCEAAIAGGSRGAWATRGAVKAMRGDLDGALADYAEAIKLNPADGAAWACRADALRLKGDFASALPAYDRAIELDPKPPRAWRGRSEVRFRTGNHEGAKTDAGEAISRNGTDPEAWFLRASATRALGDAKGALADCRKALEVAPRDWVKREDVEKWVESLEAEVGE